MPDLMETLNILAETLPPLDPIIQSIWIRLLFAPRAVSSSGLICPPLRKHWL